MFRRTAPAVACLLAIACGTTGEDDHWSASGEEALPDEIAVSGASGGGSDAVPAPLASENVLAEIDVDGQVVTFLRAGDGPHAPLLMMTRGSSAGEDAVARVEREGELTFLEIFQALAPDRAPPEALIESHAVAVAAIDRSEGRSRSVEKPCLRRV